MPDNRDLILASGEMRAAAEWLLAYSRKRPHVTRIEMNEVALRTLDVSVNRKRSAVLALVKNLRLLERPEVKLGEYHKRKAPRVSFVTLNDTPAKVRHLLEEALTPRHAGELFTPDEDAEGMEDASLPDAEEAAAEAQEPEQSPALYVGAMTVGHALMACLDRLEVRPDEPVTVEDARKVTSIARKAIALAWGAPLDAVNVRIDPFNG